MTGLQFHKANEKEFAKKEGMTEKRKAEDGMKWVQAMNNIHNRAAEVVYNDLIYN